MPEPVTTSSPESSLSAAHERRGSKRYPFREAASCYSLTAKHFERCWAWIRDVSVSGVGLVLRRRFASDTVLIIEVQSTSRRFLLPLTARVTHSTQLAEGNWLIGCTFLRKLTAEELQALLAYS